MTPYYDDGQVTIYCGDARDVLPQFGPGFVHSVVTDPPYGVEFTGKAAVQRGGGTIIRQETYEPEFEDTPDYITSVVIPIIEACRRITRSVVVTPGVRNCWLYPRPDDLGSWFSAAGTGMSSWGFCCSSPILYYGSDPYLKTGQGSRPNSVGQMWPNDANKSGHPCAKPMQFVRWLVARASLEGETILDPFMGSGTTIRAARDLGRRAIGIELSEAYCSLAVDRLAQQVLPLALVAD